MSNNIRIDVHGKQLKEICKKILIAITLIILIIPCLCFADDEEKEEEVDIPELVEATSKSVGEPNINSRAAIIYDRNSKEIIYGKEENTKRKMASTTKIMTAIVTIENNNLSDTVIVSKKSSGIGGSRLGLKTGDKITVNDLLHGLMLCSGNDAAVALAEYVGGSIEGFAYLMNGKAEELGLKNTHFVTPHGLDNEEHYTTAYELACLTDYALRNKTFSNIVATKNYTIRINGKPKNLSNTNELLGGFEGVYGVKTGFTNGANRCLVTATKRETLDIITVVLGADTKKNRTQDSIKLINYAIDNYKDVNIKEVIDREFKNWKEKNESDICINKANRNKLDLVLGDIESNYITIRKNQDNDINICINTIKRMEAPVEENTIIGSLNVKVGKEEKKIINIINSSKIDKKGIKEYLMHFLNNYTNLLEEISI